MPLEIQLLIAASVGYLTGALNLAIVLSRRQGRDIREIGSGNAGFANVARTMGKKAGVIVIAWDVGKGVFSAASGQWLGGLEVALLAGAAAVLGHVYPLYFGFRGGKGLATSFGVVVALEWASALIALTLWLAAVLSTRYMAVGALVAGWAFPLLVLGLQPDNARMQVFGIAAALFLTYMHRGNLRRIFKGEEPKASLRVYRNERRYEES
jgi:glycerol-3-phosphate acyltransferase PlsY